MYIPDRINTLSGSSISFHGNLTMVCRLLADFSFSGIVVILTRRGNLSTLLSQIVLGIFFSDEFVYLNFIAASVDEYLTTREIT